jgi:hypothetical protein
MSKASPGANHHKLANRGDSILKILGPKENKNYFQENNKESCKKKA